MSGKAKCPGSNLTWTCFFFQTGNVLLQINVPANELSVYLLSA